MANKYLRKKNVSVADVPGTIYLVPAANSAIIASLRVTNKAGTSCNFNVDAFIEGQPLVSLLSEARLGPNETMDVFSGVPFNMEANDSLILTATHDNVVSWLSYLEVDRT